MSISQRIILTTYPVCKCLLINISLIRISLQIILLFLILFIRYTLNYLYNFFIIKLPLHIGTYTSILALKWMYSKRDFFVKKTPVVLK